MRRHVLGIIALVLLVLGGITLVSGPGGSSAMGFAGSSIKAGLVLGALWLALPQIEATARRLPGRFLGWFSGKNRSADKPPSPPSAPPRRPRRRSTS